MCVYVYITTIKGRKKAMNLKEKKGRYIPGRVWRREMGGGMV